MLKAHFIGRMGGLGGFEHLLKRDVGEPLVLRMFGPPWKRGCFETAAIQWDGPFDVAAEVARRGVLQEARRIVVASAYSWPTYSMLSPDQMASLLPVDQSWEQFRDSAGSPFVSPHDRVDDWQRPARDEKCALEEALQDHVWGRAGEDGHPPREVQETWYAALAAAPPQSAAGGYETRLDAHGEDGSTRIQPSSCAGQELGQVPERELHRRAGMPWARTGFLRRVPGHRRVPLTPRRRVRGGEEASPAGTSGSESPSSAPASLEAPVFEEPVAADADVAAGASVSAEALSAPAAVAPAAPLSEPGPERPEVVAAAVEAAVQAVARERSGVGDAGCGAAPVSAGGAGPGVVYLAPGAPGPPERAARGSRGDYHGHAWLASDDGVARWFRGAPEVRYVSEGSSSVAPSPAAPPPPGPAAPEHRPAHEETDNFDPRMPAPFAQPGELVLALPHGVVPVVVAGGVAISVPLIQYVVACYVAAAGARAVERGIDDVRMVVKAAAFQAEEALGEGGCAARADRRHDGGRAVGPPLGAHRPFHRHSVRDAGFRGLQGLSPLAEACCSGE